MTHALLQSFVETGKAEVTELLLGNSDQKIPQSLALSLSFLD